MNPFDTIIAHTLATLPEPIPERKKLLQTVAQVLQKKHPVVPMVEHMIEALDLYERAQSQLPLDFSHDGHFGHDGNGGRDGQ